MRRFFLTFLSIGLTIATAAAAQAPVQQAPAAMLDNGGLTINDCLLILTGLNKIDEESERLARGPAGPPRPGEASKGFEFTPGVQLDIAHNISLLSTVQRDAQVPQQRILYKLLRELPPTAGRNPGDPAVPATALPPGSEQAERYDEEMRKLTSAPCRAVPVRIKASDLFNEGKNRISTGTLSLLDKILDR